MNMQWCLRSVDMLILDWSSYFGLVVYFRERMDLLVCGVAFRRFVMVIRSFVGCSIKLFMWVMFVVVNID